MDRQDLFRLYKGAERRLAPGLRYSQELFEEELFRSVPPGATWLDLGCGHALLPAWRAESERNLIARAHTLVGLDPDFDALRQNMTVTHRVKGDASRLPFRDSMFDVVTANMVVEHLADPAAQFVEVHRVLRPGGLFIFHTPNALGYTCLSARAIPEFAKKKLVFWLEGRREEDVYPTHYRANTAAQISKLASRAGFVPQHIRLLVTTAESAVLLPFAIVELLWIRLLMTRPFRSLRTNIVAVLRKEAGPGTGR